MRGVLRIRASSAGRDAPPYAGRSRPRMSGRKRNGPTTRTRHLGAADQRRGSAEADVKLVRRAEREAADLTVVIAVEAQVGKAIEQGADGDPRLGAREVRAGAEMLAEAEGDVIVGAAVDVEAIGVGVVRL